MPTRAVLMALAGGACLTGVAVVAADTKRAEPPYPAVAPVPAAGPASSVTEPYSKTAFPERTEDGLVLLGVGLRSKYSLFSVYAYAIYGRPGDLSMLRTLPDDQFFTQVMTIESPKRIDLVFLRDITGADMKEAFATSLGQRTKDAEALKSFAAQFDNIQLKVRQRTWLISTPSGIANTNAHARSTTPSCRSM